MYQFIFLYFYLYLQLSFYSNRIPVCHQRLNVYNNKKMNECFIVFALLLQLINVIYIIGIEVVTDGCDNLLHLEVLTEFGIRLCVPQQQSSQKRTEIKMDHMNKDENKRRRQRQYKGCVFFSLEYV